MGQYISNDGLSISSSIISTNPNSLIVGDIVQPLLIIRSDGSFELNDKLRSSISSDEYANKILNSIRELTDTICHKKVTLGQYKDICDELISHVPFDRVSSAQSMKKNSLKSICSLRTSYEDELLHDTDIVVSLILHLCEGNPDNLPINAKLFYESNKSRIDTQYSTMIKEGLIHGRE